MHHWAWLFTAMTLIPVFSSGCGSSVAPGVASGEEEPVPEMTPEQEAEERRINGR